MTNQLIPRLRCRQDPIDGKESGDAAHLSESPEPSAPAVHAKRLDHSRHHWSAARCTYPRHSTHSLRRRTRFRRHLKIPLDLPMARQLHDFSMFQDQKKRDASARSVSSCCVPAFKSRRPGRGGFFRTISSRMQGAQVGERIDYQTVPVRRAAPHEHFGRLLDREREIGPSSSLVSSDIMKSRVPEP
jgi:hypothetical protein